MIDFERWDVITALFPFVDALVRKPRPVLVLPNGAFNRAHAHLIGCMITTAAGGSWPSDHAIGDLPASGLSHPSVVRWKVFTLPAAVIGRRIGALSEADRTRVSARMATILS